MIPRDHVWQLTRSLGALLILLLLLPEINQVNLSGHAIHCVQSAPYLVGGFLPPSVLRWGGLSISFMQVNAVGEFHNKYDLVIEIFDTPATRTTCKSIKEDDFKTHISVWLWAIDPLLNRIVIMLIRIDWNPFRIQSKIQSTCFLFLTKEPKAL